MRWKNCPISNAMMPPPMTASERGSASSDNARSLRMKPVSTRPWIGGTMGLEPAASTNRGAVSVRSPT
ncbi:hypothetical protein D3C72_2588600 [compost metagenome]